MSTKLRKENFINYLFPYKCKFRKNTIINFLSEIYANIHKRCNKTFDSYVFQELMQLPMIVCNKIYSTVTSKHKNQMSVDIFATNIYNIFFGDIDDKMSMMFDILDFDDDGAITYEDVFLILSHMHLIEYNLDSIEYLESIISNFFEKKKKINKDNCFNLKENFDILLLLLIFIYKYQSLINDQDLSFYDLSNQYTKNRNKMGREYTNYHKIMTAQTYTFNDYEDLEYKPTNLLLEYLDIINFERKNKKIIEYREEDDIENFDNDIFENEDLNELCDFCMDFREMKERTINQCNLEPKLFNSNFSGSIFPEQNVDSEIDRQVNYIMKNQLYKNLLKNKMNKNKKKINLDKKYTTESYSAEKTTQKNSSMTDFDNFYKKANSNKNISINLPFSKKFNYKNHNTQEIILFKQK